MNNYQHQFIRTNHIHLHVVLAGPEDGPPVILLHGFPEFWLGWQYQIDHLAQQGYRVIVPDQRGYNLSDKPRRVKDYHIDELAKDIVGLMDVLGYEQVYLAGHDWGAAVAWWLATQYADRLHKLVIMNVPYPTILIRSIGQGNWEQLKKSWYIYAFQLPRLPEIGFRRENEGEGRNILIPTSHKDTFTTQELAEYERAWAVPGAVTGMINWYRAALPAFSTMPHPDKGSITVPTLMLWGEQDVALGKELAQPSIDLCADGELIFYPEATHWIQHDEKTAVNQHLVSFFR